MEVLVDNTRYEMVRLIAEGGMGRVHEAEQLGADGFRKRVAIKIIREEYSAIEEFRSNFIGEAKVVADLIHTNIVQMYQLGKHDDSYFMVMEFVDGINLEEFILQHLALSRPVPVELAAFIVSRVCRGLAHAHSLRGRDGEPLHIVHRDVNPRNILISTAGDVKLTDFGIAKARDLMYNEEGETIAGKDEYLSPEQARREVTDNRADVFSCGVILAEMVCGHNIFETENPEETRRNIEKMPLPAFENYRPGLDPRMTAILCRALERDRHLRFPAAEEMMVALELFLYRDRYGPTNEKFAEYLSQLFADGPAYDSEASSTRRYSQIAFSAAHS